MKKIAMILFLSLGMSISYAADKELPDLQAIKTLAEQGDAEAQYHLGTMYLLEEGVKQDYVELEYSQSELDNIYQVLDEYDGCNGSPIPQHVEEACQAIDGTMQRAGKAGCFMCVRQYSDGGQVCANSSECQGLCKGVIGAEEMKDGNFVGSCAYDDNPFGCYAIIEKGKQVGGGCID